MIINQDVNKFTVFVFLLVIDLSATSSVSVHNNLSRITIISESLEIAGINITSNTEFLEFTNTSITSGQGTLDNPYLISNVIVNDTISIKNTNLHFILLNWTFDYRVDLVSVENIKFEKSIFRHILHIELCTNISILSSVSEYPNPNIHSVSIDITKSSNIQVIDYQTLGSYWSGIEVGDSNHILLENISFNHNGFSNDISYFKFNRINHIEVNNVSSTNFHNPSLVGDTESWWEINELGLSNINLFDFRIRFNRINDIIIQNSNFVEGEFKISDGQNITIFSNNFDQLSLELVRSTEITINNNNFSNYRVGIILNKVNKTTITSNYFVNLNNGIIGKGEKEVSIAQNTFVNVDAHVNLSEQSKTFWGIDPRFLIWLVPVGLLILIRIKNRHQ